MGQLDDFWLNDSSKAQKNGILSSEEISSWNLFYKVLINIEKNWIIMIFWCFIVEKSYKLWNSRRSLSNADMGRPIIMIKYLEHVWKVVPTLVLSRWKCFGLYPKQDLFVKERKRSWVLRTFFFGVIGKNVENIENTELHLFVPMQSRKFWSGLSSCKVAWCTENFNRHWLRVPRNLSRGCQIIE